jgi:hypothetical protein
MRISAKNLPGWGKFHFGGILLGMGFILFKILK